MHHDATTNKSLRTAIAVGLITAIVGAVWLVVVLADRDAAPANVARSERVVPPSTPETAGVESNPAEPSPPVLQAEPTPEATLETPAETTPETTAEATVEPRLVEPTPMLAAWINFDSRLLLEFDLDTGSSEFSAIALNEELDRLLIADDEGRVFEFDLDEGGEPVLPARRTLRIAVGGGDIEGMAWMSGTTYVLAHEDDGRLTVVDFGDDVTNVTDEHLQRTIDTGIREVDGSGLEGVAYLYPGIVGSQGEFVVIDERPPTLYVIDRDGVVSPGVLLDIGAPDISDLWVTPNGVNLVLSDEARSLTEVIVDAEAGNHEAFASLSLTMADGHFEQPEGVVASRDGTRLYVVSESPGPGRFSFGLWRSSGTSAPD